MPHSIPGGSQSQARAGHASRAGIESDSRFPGGYYFAPLEKRKDYRARLWMMYSVAPFGSMFEDRGAERAEDCNAALKRSMA